MNTKLRLTRKPMTTALWVVLVAAMSVLITMGAAMMYSSGSLTGILDRYHTSIAVRTDMANYETHDSWYWEDKTFTQADVEQFEAMDCVEKVYFHTVSGASIPELTPALAPNLDHISNESYCDIMVVGEITELILPLDDHPGLYGTLKIEEMILENTSFTHWGNTELTHLNFSFYFTNYTSELPISVGGRYVFFGGYNSLVMRVPGYREPSTTEAYPLLFASEHACEWIDGKLLRIENSNRMSYAPGEERNITGPALLTPIEGTFEEFLADPENAIYVQMIDYWKKQQHSFPVLGTESLEAIHAFAANSAFLTDGRAFTAEEYATGARVCILNETVAAQSGIAVGDTITLEQYLLTTSAKVNANFNDVLFNHFDGMLNEPIVGQYTLLPEYDQAEAFTVVGLYRLTNEWSNSSYSFTPNTVFIPKAAQIAGAAGGPSAEDGSNDFDGTYGIYFSIKLKNGMVSDFEELMAADERFNGEFLTVDQGFGDVMDSLKAISASTLKLTSMVTVGWVLLLLLYILLYQGSQRRNVGIMRSLGASPKLAADYLWRSGMAVAAIGVAIGTAVSWGVTGAVQTKLMESAIAQLPSGYSYTALTDEAVQLMASQSQLPLWGLLLLAAAQLIIFALALRLHAGRTAVKNPRALLR